MTIGAACLPPLGALINHTCLWSLMLTCGLDPIFDAAQFSPTEVIRALVRKGYNLPSSSFCCYSALSVGLTSRVQFPSYLIIQMVNSAPFPTLWWFGVSFVNFMLKRECHIPGCQVLLVSVTDSDSVLTVLTLSWGWVTPSPHPPSPVFVGVTLLVPWWVLQCLLRCCLAPPRFSPRIPGCSLLCVLEGLI